MSSMPPPPVPRHVLVLDTSKSMLAPIAGTSQKKIEVAREAVAKIMEEVSAQHAFFGMVIFNSTAQVLFPLSQTIPDAKAIAEKTIPMGKSAIWDALAMGADLLRGGANEVVGNLVLVTDGWDNMSRYFHLSSPNPQQPVMQGSRDLVQYILLKGSNLKLQIIGIGSGTERDKGVDTAMMQSLLGAFSQRSQVMASPSQATYREVITADELYTGMVNAFLDVPFEDTEAFGALSNEELARHAAGIAQALRDSEQHSLVEHIGSAKRAEPEEGNDLDFDVSVSSDASVSAEWKQRFGPLGDVVAAFLAGNWTKAESTLRNNAPNIHPLTRAYWMARINYAKGNEADAARYLTEAWIEANSLPATQKPTVYRRLALLHSKVSGDKDVQGLVQIFERAISSAQTGSPELKKNLETMFEKILDLRRTYAGIKSNEGALEHERLVEEIFGLLQDSRIMDKNRDPNIQSFLSFVEIALSEMR